jgi:glycosyltransferase involved in cell wall biosynthesis
MSKHRRPISSNTKLNRFNDLKIAILTGGKDPHYALGLLEALVARPVQVDFVGNDGMAGAGAVKSRNVCYLNLRGDQGEAPLIEKAARVLKYYFRLIRYAFRTDSKLFHILWLNKFLYFDSTLLNLFYRVLGKKLIYTAHNIDIRQRDGNNSWLNRKSLSFMYRRMDHIFVHTEKMKDQLVREFGIDGSNVSVIPFGINDVIPKTDLKRHDARARLGLNASEKVVLFFGNIAPYKGLEYLLRGFGLLKIRGGNYRLLITGRIKNCDDYCRSLFRIVDDCDLKDRVSFKTEYIPDEEVEIYFKAADLLVLPYRAIFQSGVLFLSYNFGLPVIATNVGSLREEVIEGETGFICRPDDPDDLADKIDLYFKSDLYNNLEINRNKIIEYARERYSWSIVADRTYQVYQEVLEKKGKRFKDKG